jgi:hypothetical protein
MRKEEELICVVEIIESRECMVLSDSLTRAPEINIVPRSDRRQLSPDFERDFRPQYFF